MNFLRPQKLSPAAHDLVRFDSDSISQIVSSQRLSKPDVWLADADAYEKNGRVLRDSDSPRMLAYSKEDQVLYATDGCNACARPLMLPSAQLKEFAEKNGVRLELLEKLAGLVGRKGR